jgi:magnesium transporter
MNKRNYKFEDFEWIDIENPNESSLKALELPFAIDQNFLEDALESGHLPKIERTKDYVFMILRAYTATENEKAIEVGEISNKIAFFILKNGLITIHRAPFDFIESTPKNLESPDTVVLYLVNELLMTFEKPIKQQSDKMDQLEQNIFLHGGDNLSIEKLYFEKSKARLAKKILVIMQNVISQFKVEDKLASTLQDLKDTILDLILRTEEVVEDSNALLNSYMTFTAQRSNDVMKLLTVFSAFFLPLTFIAGVYGMNFDKMPELRWEYGYFLTLLLMLIISIGIYVWFKKKKIL